VLGTTLRGGNSSGVAVSVGVGRGDGQTLLAIWPLFLTLLHWKYLFVLCHALYAPMRVLRLADQKVPAMDKLYFYVLQTDSMLPKWLGELDGCANSFLTTSTITRMGSVAMAGKSESEKKSNNDSDEEEGVESGEDSDDDNDGTANVDVVK